MTTLLRLSTAQTAEYANCHPATVLKAAEAGELHGGQRVKGGRWSFRRECIDAWLDGETCAHEGRVSA